MNGCIFCRIVAGDIPSTKIFEDERFFAFRDINPKAEVHLLAIPREHIDSLNELDEAHDKLMGHMLRQLPKIAKQQGLDDGFRTIINTGKGGGQIIFHLHIHVLGGRKLSDDMG